jgi:hypothetical protein
MNVLLRRQWGGTPIGLSVKLTHLGHPHNHHDFQLKKPVTTGYNVTGSSRGLTIWTTYPSRRQDPSKRRESHTQRHSHILLDLIPSEDPSSNLIASHLVKKFLPLRKWAFVSAFTKTGPLDCLHAHRTQCFSTTTYDITFTQASCNQR